MTKRKKKKGEDRNALHVYKEIMSGNMNDVQQGIAYELFSTFKSFMGDDRFNYRDALVSVSAFIAIVGSAMYDSYLKIYKKKHRGRPPLNSEKSPEYYMDIIALFAKIYKQSVDIKRLAEREEPFSSLDDWEEHFQDEDLDYVLGDSDILEEAEPED